MYLINIFWYIFKDCKKAIVCFFLIYGSRISMWDKSYYDALQQVVTKVLEEAGYTKDCSFSVEDFIQVQELFSVSSA